MQEAYESIMSGNAKTGGSTQTNHQAAQQASQRQHGYGYNLTFIISLLWP